MRYRCMEFGWYQELLRDVSVNGLAAAEAMLLEMLDHGAMIVHVYRDTDLDNPEFVGRHARLRAFFSGDGRPSATTQLPVHEIERFLLDPANLDAWLQAEKSNTLLDQRWYIDELWSAQPSSSGIDRKNCFLYGKATLIASAAASNPAPGQP